MKKHALIAASLFIISQLSACSPYKPSDSRAAICNELNSKLIFNGGTSNTRRSEIQNSEDMLIQRQYEKYHCDQG